MGTIAQGPWQWWLVLAGWSAVVVFWHSSVVALLFAAWRVAHASASPRRHHATAVAAIATALVLAVLTPGVLVQWATRQPEPTAAGGITARTASAPQPVAPAALQWTAAASAVATAPRVRMVVWWLGAAWMSGCAVLLLRLFWRLAAVRWLRARARPATSGAVVEAVASTCAAWSLPRPVVLTSASLDAPVALGMRRPAVILPRDAEARLPLDALTSLIAHELAHVARRDYAVNVAQSFADAVLFFSPGARWISACAREAREFCCDDLAVDRCGGPGPYARALVLLAGLGVTAPLRPAVGAAGPRLIVRVRRLLQEDSMTRHPRSHVAIVIASLALAVAGGRSLVAASVAGVLHDATASPVAQPPATLPDAPTRTDAPSIETTVPIPYPDDARAAGVQGPVALSVTTDTLGQPTSVQVIAGEPLLTVAAVDAVGQWRFAPSDAPKTFMLGVNVVPRDAMASQPQVAALKVGGPVRPPTRTVNVNPVYPGEARDAGVQGIVIMEARIGTDGIVDSAVVLRSVPALDAAAVLAVVQWQYTPTLLNGAPVPVLMTVTVNFTLQ